jgi:membrane carboxypeptidase/penicillin-binding protein
MGNPLRKESLGAGMTGGHGAVPYFNAFMNAFMKGKPKDTFPEPPAMPNDIRALSERNKREELEKLSEADTKARQTGALLTSPKVNTDPALLPPDKVGVETPETKPEGKPPTTMENIPTVKRPETKPPVTKPDPPVEKPAGEKRKGKKGDG